MKVGVLGTGMVGVTIASKLVSLGHEVMMGSRVAGQEKAVAWVARAGKGASEGSFAACAAFGELLFLCTQGTVVLDVLGAAGLENLRGKPLVDVTNPLDFSAGFPPTLSVKDTDSLGEQVQRLLPDTKVVKTLNTMNASVMAHPEPVGGGDHTVFLSGDNPTAKAVVEGLLLEMGHTDILDLGGIETARGVEMYLPLWLRVMGALGTADFQVKVVRG
jgi:8-hydroxy-5-deazaflavin:NADPH oxidoreductase